MLDDIFPMYDILGLLESIPNQYKKNALQKYWSITRILAMKIAEKRHLSNRYVHVWAYIINKTYDGVIDDLGEKIIHPSEPYQAVFFNRSHIKVLDHIDRTLHKSSSWDEDKIESRAVIMPKIMEFLNNGKDIPEALKIKVVELGLDPYYQQLNNIRNFEEPPSWTSDSKTWNMFLNSPNYVPGKFIFYDLSYSIIEKLDRAPYNQSVKLWVGQDMENSNHPSYVTLINNYKLNSNTYWSFFNMFMYLKMHTKPYTNIDKYPNFVLKNINNLDPYIKSNNTLMHIIATDYFEFPYWSSSEPNSTFFKALPTFLKMSNMQGHDPQNIKLRNAIITRLGKMYTSSSGLFLKNHWTNKLTAIIIQSYKWGYVDKDFLKVFSDMGIADRQKFDKYIA